MDKKQLDRLLMGVEKPVRYMGNEYNMIIKDKGKVDIRYAFAFPDVYEVGMSHLGMKILYHLINEREDSYCERVFAPWTDMEEEMRRLGIPLFSLETKDPLDSFDIIGFTLQYEMSYTNVLNMLDLGGIPLTSKERGEDDPIVMAGGPCAYNVEPMADFFDLVVMGEGEEVTHELLDLFLECKKEGKGRKDFLLRAATVEGVYVPEFYSVEYLDDGRIKAIYPNTASAPKTIRKRIIADLDKAYYPRTMIVPYMDIVHDRVMLEIFRGCTRGCRFCQAGMIYRPVRERSSKTLLKLADELIKNTGYEEISLSSLSTGDYSELEPLVKELMENFREDRVGLSLPSLRLDSFDKALAEEIQKVRKTGLTFAPEAGSQRMRDIINKGITEDDLLDSARDAFKSGWSGIKLYFMIGLPGETLEDLKGIRELTEKIRNIYREIGTTQEGGKKRKPLRITIGTSSFVPKAFTPFQWVPQNSMEELGEKQVVLQKELRGRHLQYNWNDPKQSFLEAILARGDRRLGKVIKRAWELGCVYDGWTEHFDYELWMEAFNHEGIDPHFYANRERSKEEVFPWDHIDVGVTKAYLWREYQKALQEETTRDCRMGCTGCGISGIWEGTC